MKPASNEHALSQQIRLNCPEGNHRLGKITANAGDLVMFDAGDPSVMIRARVSEIMAGPLRPGSSLVWRQAEQVLAVCPGCVRAGRRKATSPTILRHADLLAVLAAQQVYGPASVTVSFTKGSVREALREIIPEGDPERAARQSLFNALKLSTGRDS